MDGELPLWKSYLRLYMFCCLCATFLHYINNTTFHSDTVELYFELYFFVLIGCVFTGISSVSISLFCH